ncbi:MULTISPECIES: ATP-binding protein [Persephonella]|uniref:ATP-binding protein n=1 Tax=Persephonella TaxID=182899 RepID=UPI0002D59957|nr:MULTISPECIES: ATP-binding protein [Persephonella]
MEDILKDAVKTFPAIFISGARQTGKSTLSIELCSNYITFDDINAYLSAKNDPVNFIMQIKTPVVLDEVQKVPEVFEAIKKRIDTNRKPNEFILTGSVNILRFRKVKESLAGRLAIFELYPLSIFEVFNKKENLIEKIFSGKFLEESRSNLSFDDLLGFILKGGFPEIHKIESEKMRYIWFSSYVSTYIEKDVLELGEIRNIDKFLTLLNIISSYSGNLINKSKISQFAGIDNKTLDYYLNLLQLIYQIKFLRPFSQNVKKRFIKTPKIYFNDTGLLCYLLGITSINELKKHIYFGNIVETFMFNEFLKHSACSQYPVEIFFYRTTDKKEIDFILKYRGEYIAVELKTSSTVSEKDFLPMKDIYSLLKYGIVLYKGDRVFSFGDRFFAVPFKNIF